jgi:hypothetical protein
MPGKNGDLLPESIKPIYSTHIWARHQISRVSGGTADMEPKEIWRPRQHHSPSSGSDGTLKRFIQHGLGCERHVR